jgi:hypothetical protein
VVVGGSTTFGMETGSGEECIEDGVAMFRRVGQV